MSQVERLRDIQIIARRDGRVSVEGLQRILMSLCKLSDVTSLSS